MIKKAYGFRKIRKKEKKDALVQCVTRTAEISIKESVMRKDDERLKVHVENVDFIAREAWYRESCRKAYTRKPQRNFPKLVSKNDREDFNERKRHQSEEEESHLNTFVNMSKNTSLKKHMLFGYHS